MFRAPRRETRLESEANGKVLEGVGFFWGFVGAVLLYSGKPEGQATVIGGRALYAVDGDLDDQLGTYKYGDGVSVRVHAFSLDLQLQEPLGLPGE